MKLYKVDKRKYKPSKGEKPVGKSKTVPNESFTTRELLMKHANGTMYDNKLTPYYEEQANFSTMELSKMQSMDEVDKLIYLQEIKQKAAELETKISDYKSEMEAVQAARQKELEQQQKQNATQEQSAKS